MIGIYRILNIETQKIYIGKSSNIPNRWLMHKSNLKSGTHHNHDLSKDYAKYGLDTFDFKVVEECSLYLLDQREKYFINLIPKDRIYNSDANNKWFLNTYGSRPNSTRITNSDGSTAKIMKCSICGYDRYTSDFINQYCCAECVKEDNDSFEIYYENLVDKIMLKSKKPSYQLNENYLKF